MKIITFLSQPQTFTTSHEVLPHHEVHKGVLKSSASRNTSLNLLPKALLTVSVHTGDRVFEIKGVVDPGVSVSKVWQLLVGSPAICVDCHTRQNPMLNERKEDGCCPLTPRTWYNETPVHLPFNSSQNPILHSGLFLGDASLVILLTHTTHKHKQTLELYSSLAVFDKDLLFHPYSYALTLTAFSHVTFSSYCSSHYQMTKIFLVVRLS